VIVDNAAVQPTPLSAVAVVVSFVDHINRRDANGLVRLMSADHRLEIFDEDPVVGREANAAAWRGYFYAFPDYLIHPRLISESDGTVAILGHTTGSHLGLPDDEERELTLIWIGHAADGAVTRWRLLEDNPANRKAHGLDATG
jgi:hypothetical protein